MLFILGYSNSPIKNTAYTCFVVFLVFAVAYVPLFFKIGYNYDLHVVSTVVFTFVGVFVAFGLVRGGSERFEEAGRARVLFGTLAVVLMLEEILLNSVLVVYGMALAMGGLVLLPVMAVVFGLENEWLRTALETMALVFATRIVLSPFPVNFFNHSVFLPMIYTLILGSLVLYLTLRRIPAREIRISRGIHGVFFQGFVGLEVGAIVGIVEYLVLRPQPILTGASPLKVFLYTFIVMGVMVGVAEELLFRGLLQGSLERVMPVWQAIGISSIMFGLMHVGWMNPLEVLLAYGAGVAFGCLALATDSLIAPVTAHGFGNVVLYLMAFLR